MVGKARKGSMLVRQLFPGFLLVPSRAAAPLGKNHSGRPFPIAAEILLEEVRPLERQQLHSKKERKKRK